MRGGCQWRMLPRDFPPWGTVASLGEAIKLDPKDMVSTRARGLAYFHAGDATKALPDLTAAIEASGGLSVTTDADALLCRG